ncbi:MAG: glycosyltransferase family 8 protein [Bacteroidales bacterium]|nr:glycosyltransferase family 8 protein [Bacteroidales bacterium]
MKTIPILFTFDASLELAAGVCFTSLLESADPSTFYDIYVLHSPACDFSGSRLNELPERYGNCRLTFRKVEGEFVGGYEVRGIPETAYYRLLSPELIPEYDKLLYSDVDVIIREDLGKFYDIELGDNYFAGVDNCSRLRPGFRDYIGKTLGLDWQKGYFYSGNLIINSALLREGGLLNEFRALAKNDYLYQDMDIINIACNGRILPLGPSYCITVQLYDLIVDRRGEMEEIYGKEEIDRALSCGIVHYNGAKPWKEACPNMDIWWDCYRRSIFFDERFCRDFWVGQRDSLEKLSLLKRIKLLLRYPIDRRAK